MEVILTKDVDNLGRAGEVVQVKPGFGRNYLLPQGLAMLATRSNKAQLDHHRKRIEAEQSKLRSVREEMAKRIGETTVSIARQAGEEDKLFGSVSTKDIAEALLAQNIEVDRRIIQLSDALRTVGTHEVNVRFSAEVQATLRVNVIGIKK